MIGLLARAGAAMQGARRSRVGGGGVAPTITVAPVLTWTVEIGTSPAITPPTYTGDAGTITYTLLRDGVPVASYEDVSEATLEAYVATADDIGPDLDVEATVTNGTGSDSATSNAVVFDDATYLPETAIGVSTAGLTLADSDTTVDSWAATLGGVACTLTAPGGTNRPAYSASGGVGSRPLVTTDGTDDVITGIGTKGSAWSSYEFGVVGSRVSGSLSGGRWINYYNAGSIRFGLQNASATQLRCSVTGGANVNSTTDPDGVVAHYSGDSSAGTQNVRVGGSVEGTTSATTTSRADGGEVTIGANAAGTNPANLALQAWHIGPALTSDQRAHLRALLTYYTGVSC